MESKVFLSTALLLAAFLAGCSDGPASGTFTPADAGLVVDGTATVDYTAASSPAQDPQGNPLCPPTAVPPTGPVTHCVEAATTIDGHFMSLPEPDGNGWAVYGMGPSAERQLVLLTPAAGGMYNFNYTAEQDLSTTYTTIEARMGDFTYATAPATEGAQVWTIAPIAGITVTGSFKGKTLDIDVSNIPGNGTKLLGRLYMLAEDGNMTPTAQFDILPGANHYEDEDNAIGKYAEFHIHVGNSKINLYKSTITKK